MKCSTSWNNPNNLFFLPFSLFFKFVVPSFITTGAYNKQPAKGEIHKVVNLTLLQLL